MEFIRKFVEQKIASATGAAVRMGAFSFSPLSGTVEMRDLEVAAPLLSIRRIEAKLAVARALRQEIVIKSLVIDGPDVRVVRRSDGTFNFPQRTGSAPAPKTQTADSSSGKWEFEAQKVLLVGGRVEFTDETLGGYRVSIEKLDGSLEATPAGFEFVAEAGSLGRRDQAVELGEAQLVGRLPGVTDLANIARGAVELSLKAGELLRIQVQTPSIASRTVSGELSAAATLQWMKSVLPSSIRLPLSDATGDVKLDARGSYSPVEGLLLSTLQFSASSVRLR